MTNQQPNSTEPKLQAHNLSSLAPRHLSSNQSKYFDSTPLNLWPPHQWVMASWKYISWRNTTRRIASWKFKSIASWKYISWRHTIRSIASWKYISWRNTTYPTTKPPPIP